MSLKAAAQSLAEHLLESEFVEVYAHHDADGIAAASTLCHALYRAGIGFHLRIRSRISHEDIAHGPDTLLCDFGSSLDRLNDEVMVVDHHVPHFDGPYHVNPRLHQIDGESDLSASGAAYIVAQEMGDNRDLAGLALIGMIGDGQACVGTNHEICSEGMALGFISPHRGLCLAGRDPSEQLFLALKPHLAGISGDEEAVSALTGQYVNGEEINLESLLSDILLQIAPNESVSAMEGLYGDTYELEREVMHNAHTLAALVDACGQSGMGGMAASLCFRSAESLEEAWKVARSYRLSVIDAIRTVNRTDDSALYEVENISVLRGVADALANDYAHDTPLAVMARTGEKCIISLRCPPGVNIDLEALVRSLAAECGGSGGGHKMRAGMVIGANALECFKRSFTEAIA